LKSEREMPKTMLRQWIGLKHEKTDKKGF